MQSMTSTVWTVDEDGPTVERLRHAGEFFVRVGRARSSRHFTMLDDALGRAWVRSWLSGEEYSALRRYALHWLAGGLCGGLQSADLDRIYAVEFNSDGLACTERQLDHRNCYYAARTYIGARPGYVADQVACYDSSPLEVGMMMGYRSAYHGRAKAVELLSEAGYRLTQFWSELDRAR